MKNNILLIFLIPVLLLSQPKRKSIFIEVHQFPDDSLTTVYLSYRLPYNEIVFVKNENGYDGKVTFEVESLQNQTVVERQTSIKQISVTKYEDTQNRKLSIEGLLKFNLQPGQYRFIPEIAVDNSEINVKLKPILVTVKSNEDSIILEPIVLYNTSDSTSRIFNLNNYIPYSRRDYPIAILGKNLTKLNVKISQNSNLIIDTLLNNPRRSGIYLEEQNGNVELSYIKDKNSYSIFYLSGFSGNLLEGKVNIELTDGELKNEYTLEVYWIDKPISLYNPEFAVKLLNILNREDKVSQILSLPKESYYKALINFWNQEFPSKNYKFNEAMNEFYRRADYALRHFNYLGGRNGAETDRGKVYIKYGKPTDISRSYSEKNEVLEFWNYDKLGKQFVFIDRTGTGDFDLLGKK